jgi:nucleotide-binding universal stress UspA family protein
MAVFPARVLVAVGNAPSTEHALRAAVELCAVTGSQLSLGHVKLVTHTVAGVPPSPIRHDALEAEGQHLLRSMTRQVEDLGGKVIATHLRLGRRIGIEMARLCSQVGVDIVVVGGRSTKSAQTAATLPGRGGTSMEIARSAPCSVLVARPPSPA